MDGFVNISEVETRQVNINSNVHGKISEVYFAKRYRTLSEQFKCCYYNSVKT